MDTLFNLTAVKNKMNDIPKGQRINNYFDGALTHLNKEQKVNLLEIINKHHNDIVDFINSSMEINEIV